MNDYIVRYVANTLGVLLCIVMAALAVIFGTTAYLLFTWSLT